MTSKICPNCGGDGIDPYDTDPLGRSMNTPCNKCSGTGKIFPDATYEVMALCANCHKASRLKLKVGTPVKYAECPVCFCSGYMSTAREA